MSEELTQQLPNGETRIILARLDSIDTRLTALEDKVDRPLQETRPIWEHVLARLEKIEFSVEEFRTETRRNFRIWNGV
jgi:hypothetical protein